MSHLTFGKLWCGDSGARARLEQGRLARAEEDDSGVGRKRERLL